MPLVRLMLGMFTVATIALSAAQPPPPPPAGQPTTQPPGQPGQPPGGRGGRGGGRGRGGAQLMTISTTAWPDGGMVPLKYSQAGAEVSPPISWTGAPAEGIASYVVIFHDIDAAAGDGTSDLLHWMLWNIPGTATSLPEGVPPIAQLPDGTRQISGTGPYYRGPGALASGPAHHYVLELFALDAQVNVPAVGQSPAETRAAVVAAMAGHVRAKGVYVGLFKRGG